jgi:hypothetical protein
MRVFKCSFYCISLQTGYIISPSQLLLPLSVLPRVGRPTSPDSHSYVRPPVSMHQYYIVLHSIISHSSDFLFIHVLLEAVVQVLPPLEEERIANELEPRGEL